MWASWKSAFAATPFVAKSLLNATPNLLPQQTRTTIILKRVYPIRLHKKGSGGRRLEKKDFIYKRVDGDKKKQAPLSIILTQYVEGVGEKGDKVNMKRQKAYTHFLLPGLAVYASPENMKKYYIEQDDEKTNSSLYAPNAVKVLSRCCLIVNLSVDNPWTIEKWHIRANFRKMNVFVTDDAITLPEKPISGPNLDYEGKEFYITLTINKTETVKVRCKIHHDTFIYSKELPLVPEYWKIPGKAIFEEDQEILDSLPRPKWEDTMTVKD
ncbi:39S ribosomal protein L9, mitochondrial [Trichogramma pretiosum]|uniref:39S ribosomal protein L9, mitochondrial n=1 Tax=Trichogramma pretiosum TaxID=7493 RepID=UPI0006C9DA8A|nr:39S ribosomal protein L9, mitochondrial [Trichogramma pretiosum]